MPKTPDERIELLEKKVNRYRLLATCLGVLLVLVLRKPIMNWVDGAENWVSNVANTRAN
jgi:hypothetical protein